MGIALELSPDMREHIARDLFQVKKKFGHELHGLCPYHAEKEPSFSYNVEKDACHCLSCGASDDLAGMWCHEHGHDVKTGGLRKFKQAFGLSDGGSLPPVPRSPGRSKADMDKGEKIIPESSLAALPPLPKPWVDRLTAERKWSPAIVEELDLRVHGDDRTSRIAIPVRDEQGRLLNIRLYLPGAKKYKIISWSETIDGKKVNYGASRLLPASNKWRKGEALWLCEGEPDLVCALSHGLNAVTQTAGAKTFKPEFVEKFRDRDVVICYDADQAGIDGARNVAEKLTGVARLVRVLEWPAYMAAEDGGWPEKGGQDLTDFFCRHGKTVQDLQNLLPQAAVFERPPEPERPAGTRRFFDKRTFRPQWLADAIQQDLDVLADPLTQQMFRWTGKYWKPWHMDRLRSYAKDLLGDEAEPARLSAAADLVYLDSLLPEDRELNDHADMVCLENGMLDLVTMDFKPHHKDYLSTQILPFPYDAKASCDRWIAFLEEVIQDKFVRAQLQQFFGYCLTRSTNYETALLLIGPGSDGKSKILNVLQEMIGEENCSAVQMSRLEEPFERATLYNKLLNVATEENKAAFGSAMVKAAISGDRVNASFKHKDYFQFRPYAKHAFSSNFFPAVPDNTDGYFRRWLPIEFTKQFGPGMDAAKDVHLEEKLLKELPGIFLWSLAGLEMLRENDGFIEAEATNKFLNAYKRHNNPIMWFIEDNCILEEGGRAAVDALYSRYVKVLKQAGNNPLNRQNFMQGLHAVVRPRGRKLKACRMSVSDPVYPRARGYEGIRLLDRGEAAPPVPPSPGGPL